jgi:hypothetical protein
MKILKSSRFFADTLKTTDVLVLAGPGGVGKTELALNLSTFLTNSTVVDLDFCKGDFTLRSDRFQAPICIPQKKNPMRYADTPIIDQELLALIGRACAQSQVIIDLGGDQRGLKIFQVVRPLLAKKNWHVSLVVNFRRPFFREEENYRAFIGKAEEAFNLQLHSLIANTHLLELTDWMTLQEGWQRTRSLAGSLSLPLFFTAIWEAILPSESRWECFEDAVVAIKRFLCLPWEE